MINNIIKRTRTKQTKSLNEITKEREVNREKNRKLILKIIKEQYKGKIEELSLFKLKKFGGRKMISLYNEKIDFLLKDLLPDHDFRYLNFRNEFKNIIKQNNDF